MKCTKCGNDVQDDAMFCDLCGARLSPLEGGAASAPVAPMAAPASAGEARCAKCGASNMPGEMFCSECGAPLAAPVPVAPTALVAPVAPAARVEPMAVAANPRCAACGAELEPGDAFCFACGAAVAPTPAAAPATATVAEPIPAAAAAVVAAPVRAGECPSCGAKVEPGDPFCAFCGAALAGQGAAAAKAQPMAVRTAVAGPRLIVEQANGNVEIPLGEGREVTVGREDPYSSIFPDVDLTPYGAEEAGISRRHFKLTLAEGQYAIQDLNSTNRTLLNRAPVAPGAPMRLKDGDEICAGRLKLTFRIAP